jgi:hypothetical protein
VRKHALSRRIAAAAGAGALAFSIVACGTSGASSTVAPRPKPAASPYLASKLAIVRRGGPDGYVFAIARFPRLATPGGGERPVRTFSAFGRSVNATGLGEPGRGCDLGDLSGSARHPGDVGGRTRARLTIRFTAPNVDPLVSSVRLRRANRPSHRELPRIAYELGCEGPPSKYATGPIE